MAFWEYIWSWPTITKWLYHLNWNANDSSWNWYNWTANNLTYSNIFFWWNAWNFNWSSSYIDIWNIDIQSSTTFSVFLNISRRTVWDFEVMIDFEKKFIIQFDNSWTWYKLLIQILASDWASSQWLQCMPLNNNQKYNIWFVYNNWTIKSYINWLYYSSISWKTTYTWAKWIQRIWCYRSWWYFYDWYIDDVIIDTKAWTDEEVKKYYTETKWRFWFL